MVLIALKRGEVLQLPLRSYRLYNRLSQFRFDKWVGPTALSSLQLVVWCIIGDLSPGESLEIDSFLLFPLSLLVSLSIIPMVDFHRPVLDWI